VRVPSAAMRGALPAELAFVGITAAWGLSFVVVPWTLEAAPVMTTITLRAAIGLAVLLALRPAALRATRLEWRAGLLAGLLLGLGYVLQTAGLTSADAGKSGFLTAFYVALVPLCEALVYRRLPVRRDLVALGVATAGIALMVLKSDLTLDLAEGLVALSAVAWASHIVVVGRVAERVDPLRFAAVQMLVLAAVGAAGTMAETDPMPRWSTGFVASIVFLGVVTNALGFLVQAWGQKIVPPTRTAILFSGEPVFAALFGFWLAEERFGMRDLAGAALVMAAVAFTVFASRNEPSPAQAGS
jgi:drug/metabolite transporter (DMT)-like permease